MQTIAKVEAVIPLTDTILQVILTPEKYIGYKAGQYLQIVSSQEALSYSIANAPLGAQKYELHIRHNPDNALNQALLNEMKTKGQLKIQLPFGDCSLEQLKPHKAIGFIAAGTGFAPAKAMIEQLLASSDPRAFSVFWLARNQSDLYMDNILRTWESHVKQCSYLPLLSAHDKLRPILESNDLLQKQWILSGPFDLAFSLRDALIEQGVSKDCIYSDAFSFESK